MALLRRLGAATALLCLASAPSFAMDWSASLGVNGGDVHTLTGDLTLGCAFPPLYENTMLEVRPLLEASAIFWENSHQNIFGGGLSAGIVVDFRREGAWRPYLAGTFGGVLISDDEIGSHDLGCNFQFRSKASLGIRFGESFRHHIQVDVSHFSNAGLNSHNSGFNTVGASYGFRF